MVVECNIQDLLKCRSFFITSIPSLLLNKSWFDLNGVLDARDLSTNELTTTIEIIVFSDNLEELKVWCDLENIKVQEQDKIYNEA